MTLPSQLVIVLDVADDMLLTCYSVITVTWCTLINHSTMPPGPEEAKREKHLGRSLLFCDN